MVRIVAHGFARSPVTALDAELSGWHPVDLAVVVAGEALIRARLSADRIDEIVVGCAEPVGAQGADAARAVALGAGWPARIGGSVIDRAETSGSTALQSAADAIRAGRWSRVAVVGLGMSSTVPPGASALNRTYGAPWGAGVAERTATDGGLVPAPVLAETVAVEIGITREDLDGWAERSLERRRRSSPPSTLVGIAARPGTAAPLLRRGDNVSGDGLRDWGSAAELPPTFDPGGLTTAASFAPPADSVAALVLEGAISSESAPEAAHAGGNPGSHPVLELIGSGRAAGEPSDPTGAAATAVERALGEAAVDLATVDLIEVVETSAATAILVGRALGIEPGPAGGLDQRGVNPHGGALATGDAGAAEELRLVIDGSERLEPGGTLLAVSAGPTGSAATLWRRAPAPIR